MCPGLMKRLMLRFEEDDGWNALNSANEPIDFKAR